MTAPSFSQIKAQVAAIRQKVSREDPIGIHSAGRWTGETIKFDGEQGYSIHQCDSPLSFRIALRQPTDEGVTKVLITGLDEHDLGEDVMLRLAKRKLFPIDPWQIVRSLFDAHAVDPRLTKQAWIAEALLELNPADGFPAARGGFLDSETVWPLLLEGAISFRAESPDLTSLLKWSLDADATSEFRRRPDAFRQGAANWLAEKAGPAAKTVLHFIEKPDRADAVPLGLAAAVVYHPLALGKLEKATGKLEERFLGGKSPDTEQMQRWSTAATEVVRSLRHTASKSYHQTIQRADKILCDIQAEGWAHLSDTSSLGFDQRLVSVGETLSGILDQGNWNRLEDLVAAQKQVSLHDQSASESRRVERIEMALRLMRWLANQDQHGPHEPKSFAEAADNQLHEGGFVDWARLSLRSGDPIRELSEGYARLFNRVRDVREQQSQTFGKLLIDWTAANSHGDQIIPVEKILDEVVTPLAADALVLVIVIDGMSTAVCRELLADMTKHDWILLAEPGHDMNRPGVATIPSVTEFSRTSLLCGKRSQGTQEDETIGFAKHPGLLEHSRSGSPPVLFHKAGLQQESDDSILSAEVRREIASTHRRVVGVVVNAVDDHLLKGEQIDTRWSRDEIKVLPALLHEARIARRLVVLVSDHGHVLDCQAEGRPFKEDLAGGERWRSVKGDPENDELFVKGSRVLTDGHQLIAPWSERVRYGMKKNGYHGGLSPQEMIVPIVVLASTDSFPKAWSEQLIDTPDWWDVSSPSTIPKAEKPVPKLKPVASKPIDTLFDMEEEPQLAVTDAAIPQWVSSLLSSPVFEDQKRFAGRGVPTDEIFARLLSSLDQRGGKMTSVALARTLEVPKVRLPGLLAKAERVLNVDGYDVLRRDGVSETVELNRSILLKQFDLVE
ncbi:BREX-2 system phosphatase PglZ [Blastopirellula marina]|uniref:BREX-2 system phosphatase PglZ n=1 Tax=Blastopirellula marina TaxID=124 RepID=A0A2S8F9T7_9BACT|nr:BREX-2 system phosphatase PglZ [Blastopirellula marina]PQO28927.1 BREX-2 system phosphatase PglZ [Blastopirellula marina]PTL42200.1 BREX-2 system phosphatase PglZ [Blastopirellula marina]